MHMKPTTDLIYDRCDISLGEFCFSVMDAVTALIAYVDRTFQCRYVNESYSRLFCRPIDGCLGQNISKTVGDEVFQNCLKPMLEKCFRGETPTFEGWMPLPDVGEHYIDMRLFPHRAGNEIIGAAIVAHDLTDKKAIIRDVIAQNKELEQNLERLEESNRQLHTLLETVMKDREKTESSAYYRVSESIAPYLQALKTDAQGSKTAELADSIESTIMNYKPKLDQKLYKLNPNLSARERRIAHLVVEGKTSQEIADLVGKSVKTVEYYRSSLRKKLGLNGHRVSLRTFLVS